MKRVLVLTMLVAASLFSAGPARADVIIDDFRTPNGGQIATAFKNGPVTANSNLGGQPAADVLGSSREIQVHYANPQTGANQSITGSANNLNSHLFVFSQSTSAQGTAIIRYDAHANGTLQSKGLDTPFPPNGVDLTQGGLNTGILFQNLTTLSGNLKIEVNLYNGITTGIWSTGVVTLPNTGGSPINLFFDFATQFSGGGGAATPTHVGAVEIFIDGRFDPGASLSYGRITATAMPEPSTLAGGLVGGLGLLGLARRRARKSA